MLDDDLVRTGFDGSLVIVSGGGTSDGGGEGSMVPWLGLFSDAGGDSDSVMMTRGYLRLWIGESGSREVHHAPRRRHRGGDRVLSV
jgi:hypothetical protein